MGALKELVNKTDQGRRRAEERRDREREEETAREDRTLHRRALADIRELKRIFGVDEIKLVAHDGWTDFDHKISPTHVYFEIDGFELVLYRTDDCFSDDHPFMAIYLDSGSRKFVLGGRPLDMNLLYEFKVYDLRKAEAINLRKFAKKVSELRASMRR